MLTTSNNIAIDHIFYDGRCYNKLEEIAQEYLNWRLDILEGNRTAKLLADAKHFILIFVFANFSKMRG